MPSAAVAATTVPPGVPARRPHRNLTPPHRNLTPPHRNLTPPHRNLTQPHRNLTQPHRNLTQPNRDTSQPVAAVGPPTLPPNRKFPPFRTHRSTGDRFLVCNPSFPSPTADRHPE
jgi:hypothetical protein